MPSLAGQRKGLGCTRGKGILANAWGKFHVKCVLCWQPLDKREGLTCARCDERHKKRQVEQNAAGDEAN